MKNNKNTEEKIINKTNLSVKSIRETAQNIGRQFLNDLDGLIDQKFDKITCGDIVGIYADFVIDKNALIRDKVGSGGNFTGFSEFLIFRFIIAQLTKNYKCKFTAIQFNSKDWKYFKDENKNITVFHDCQYQGLENELKKLRPDIAIYKNNKPKFIIEIKVSRDSSAIKKAINNLRKFHNKGIRCLLLIFYPKGKTAEIIKHEDSWLKSLILDQKPNDMLYNQIETMLNLKSINND